MRKPTSSPVGKFKGRVGAPPGLGLGAGPKRGSPLPTVASAAPPAPSPPPDMGAGPGAASASGIPGGPVSPIGFRKGGKVKQVMKKRGR